MNRHAQKRLTDATLIELAARLVAAGNRTAGNGGNPGGIPIIIPAQLAEHIHALAYDATKGIAAKAQLEQVEAVAS